MKKNTIKAFTLVEMLIVIVIIGILIAALMPRMQAAQGRARDVSRKTALSQVQSAIVVWQGDNGKWPGMSGDVAASGLMLSSISGELLNAGLNSVPLDPLGSTSFTGLNGKVASGSQYQYMVSMRNGTNNGGFILMAKTEVPGGSNWVQCNSGGSTCQIYGSDGGCIPKNTDITTIHPCETIKKGDSCIGGTGCTYHTEEELRYIVLY